MRVAILGAGNVGRALAQKFFKQKIPVSFGVKSPNDTKYDDLKELYREFVSFQKVKDIGPDHDFIFLAVPWPTVPEALRELKYKKGQIICDCTNPLTSNLKGLHHQDGLSGGEKVSSLLPDAFVIKAFNHTGAGNIKNPRYEDGTTLMLVAGDNLMAKQRTLSLISKLGFQGVDIGDLAEAKHLENLALFWIHMAYNTSVGPNHSLALLKENNTL